MILETTLGYKSSWRILGLLAETPTKSISRTEIRKYTALGNEAVNLALKRFVLADILIKEKKGKKESYYLNLSNIFAQKILEMVQEERKHLRYISFGALILLNEFTRRAMEKTSFIDKVYLFGSVAKGTARASSDLDLALITLQKDIAQELTITQISDCLFQQFRRKIQVHYFTKKEFNQPKSSLIKEVKEEGIDILAYCQSLK